VTPLERTEHSIDRAAALYQTGRYFQGQNRYEPAIAAYQQLLGLIPDHVDAHNALAVIYATLGDYQQAERHFKAALSVAADAGYLYNNLGFLYLSQGRDAEALATLERAKQLSPDNERVVANLSLAAFRVGQQVAAGAAQGRSSEDPLGKPLIVESVPTAGGGGVAEPLLVKLEVANGNGIRGMAKQTARWLNHHGFPTARLTNQKPYRQEVTEIQYAQGLEAEAVRLGAALPGNAVLVAVDGLQRGVQVRIVVGHDLGVKQSRLVAASEPLRLAQAQEGVVLRP
jgi:tetratricopeptide (TPR) repeat protein